MACREKAKEMANELWLHVHFKTTEQYTIAISVTLLPALCCVTLT